jgi:hypothetical protein
MGAEALGTSDRARLRRLALDWLRAELVAHRDLPAAAQARSLGYWLDDFDLGDVRDPRGLETLPEEERQSWMQFWDEVRDLVARAGAGGTGNG